MATYVGTKTITSSYNSKCQYEIEGFYGPITRNGKKVSFDFGVRIKRITSAYTYNSIVMRYPNSSKGTMKYVQEWSEAKRLTQDVWYYAADTYKVTTETYAWTYSAEPGTDAGTATVSIGWNDNVGSPTASSSGYKKYSFDVPYGSSIPNTPSVSVNSISNTSVTMNYSSNGSDITQLRIYLNGSLWNTVNAGNSGTFVVSGLSPKTTYDIQIQSYNGLWSYMSAKSSPTTYPNPVWVTSVSVIETTPFSAKASISSSNVGDTATYCFLLCNQYGGALRNEVQQIGNQYNFTGLTPETTYIIRTRVITKNSGVGSAYYDVRVTTPPDQATVFLKTNNLWKRGKVYIKVQGSWVKAKYIYVKQGNGWIKGNNF